MGARTCSPSGGTTSTVGPVAVTGDAGASFVPWLAAVGAGMFGPIDSRASEGL
jgi:hypothetical protein